MRSSPPRPRIRTVSSAWRARVYATVTVTRFRGPRSSCFLPPAFTLIRLARSPGLPSASVTRTGPQVSPGAAAAPVGACSLVAVGWLAAVGSFADVGSPMDVGSLDAAGACSGGDWTPGAVALESRITSVWTGPPAARYSPTAHTSAVPGIGAADRSRLSAVPTFGVPSVSQLEPFQR